ncbi:MAG: hypothetical protein OXG89_09050 [bacterium]|nr:hypothetical protein [bacterium]
MRRRVPSAGFSLTIIGRLVMAALVIAPLLYGAVAEAQNYETVDDLLAGGYGLLIEVVVAEDGTSGGTARMVASSQAVAAIANRYGVGRGEACRRVAFPHTDQFRPAYLNPQLWTETDRINQPDECLYSFRYPSGTPLSVINADPDGRIIYQETVASNDASTLLDLYQFAGTVWDKEIIRPLIDEPGLGDLYPAIAIRMTYPYPPDSLESGTAIRVDGNTLIWLFSPLGDNPVDDIRGGATPFSTDPDPVTENPPDPADPFPWFLLVLAVLGSFAVGWFIGERVSSRNRPRAGPHDQN